MKKLADYVEITTVPGGNAPEVITGRRPTSKELRLLQKAKDGRARAMNKSFWLPEHLSGCPSGTGPKSLHDFSRYLGTRYTFHPTVPEIIRDLRKYYPDDKVLMQCADFLESALQDDPNVCFMTCHKYVLMPRSPDGSVLNIW